MSFGTRRKDRSRTEYITVAAAISRGSPPLMYGAAARSSEKAAKEQRSGSAAKDTLMRAPAARIIFVMLITKFTVSVRYTQNI